MTTKQIIWSDNEDDWDSAPEDKEDILQNIHDYEPEGLQAGRVIYYGEKKQPSKIFVNACDVMEMIGNIACDSGGEWAWYYPDVSPEQQQELEDFLIKWQEQFTPEWFEVVNVKEYVVTQEDVRKVL